VWRAAAFAALLSVVTAGCASEKAEGRPWIHRVELRGVSRVDKSDLEGRLAVQARSWWPLAPKTYLNPFDLELDGKRLEAYYRDHGFFDAHVLDREARPRDKSSVDVRFSVEEGAPTQVVDVEVSGLDRVNRRARRSARKQVRLAAGQRFDYAVYSADKERLAGALKQHGYAWAEVAGEVRVDRDRHEARVSLVVTPGPWTRFGTMEVRGAERIPAARLAHYAHAATGRPFSLDELEALRGHLYNLGTFSSVRIEYVHAEARPDVADLIVTVQEGTMHELKLGGGIGFESQRNDLHASVEYTKRNFLGGLRSLQLRLMPAYVAIPAVWNIQRQGPAGTTDATLTQPDLFWWTDLKFTVGVDLGIDYAYQYWGPRTSVSLGRDFWGRRVHAELGYTFQFLDFFATDPAILDRPDLAGRLYGYVDPYRLAWLQQDLQLDLRDRPLEPRRGGWLGLSAEEGGVWTGSAFSYQKLLPDVRGYLGNRRVVLAARLQFGQIFTQGDLGSPITRRFYLGGPSSHRGFNYDRLSPQVPSGLNGVPPIPIGGDQMLLTQIELRLNLFHIAGSWVAMAAFADGGDVAAPSCGSVQCRQLTGNVRPRIDLGDLNWAVGGGVRYRSPIGTVRFDVGVRVNRLSPFEADGTPNPDPGQRVAYHISVGEPF
jgi:translocation and assembly module TamA